MMKILKVVIVTGLTLGLLSGCKKENEKENLSNSSIITKEEQSNKQEGNVFEKMANREFEYSDNTGVWSTVLTIQFDGSFIGKTNDSKIGDIGDDHPLGSVGYNEFTGKFTNLEKVDDYTYKATLESLNYAKEVNSEEVKENMKYIACKAYGLDESKEYEFYLPGKKVSDLSSEYLSWTNGACDGVDTISFYGIFAVDHGDGFMSK